MNSVGISVTNMSVELGDFSITDMSFEIPAGSYAALMGQTGCGKSTILECISGLRQIQAGTICVGGRDVTKLPAAARGIGYVPQDHALFPTMTVRRHLQFPLEIRNWPPQKRDQRASELAELLGIAPLLDRYPKGLSGGEGQRVALGRALSFEPAVLLLDEPLSAVDENTREQMYEHLRRMHHHTNCTVLHVTHNPDEATALASVTLRFVDGELQADDEPNP